MPIQQRTVKQPTPQDIKKFAKDKKNVYTSTFDAYAKSRVGTTYKDFVGRSRSVSIDSESDTRGSYYYWSAAVKNALKFGLDVPSNVKRDYIKRSNMYAGGAGADAYKISGVKRVYA